MLQMDFQASYQGYWVFTRKAASLREQSTQSVILISMVPGTSGSLNICEMNDYF